MKTLPAYSEYKPSGVGWLGDVPAHWHIGPLKRYARVRYGLGQPPPELADGPPLIRATNIKSGRILEAQMLRVDPAQVPESRNATLSAGEIIVVRSGAYTGDSAIIPSQYHGAISGYDMVVTVRQGFSPYFAWQLLSPEVRQLQFGFWSLRAAQPHLNAEELHSTVVVVAPPSEQWAIAAFLDRETARIEGLVAKKERLIALLQEKRTALISHAVTKGLNPNAPMKDSGVEWLGQIPAHWSLKKIGYFARIGNGSTPQRENPTYWQDGSFPWLNSSVVNDAVVGAPPYYVTKVALKECHLPIVKPGTVLVAITGEGKTRGKAAVLDYEATINQHIAFLAPDSRAANPHFIRFSLESVYEVLRVLSEGAGSTKGALTCEQLRQFKIPLPPFHEQLSIVQWLNSETAKLDALIAKIRTGIERLREYRTALISAAVTGKIDVRQPPASASEVDLPASRPRA